MASCSCVIIARRDLEETGLLAFGARARFAILMKVQEAGIEPLVTTVREQFRGSFVSARSYRSTEDRLGEDLRVSENYLSLIGFVMGASTVTGIFLKLPAGAWSDVLGRRPMLLAGAIVFAPYLSAAFG